MKTFIRKFHSRSVQAKESVNLKIGQLKMTQSEMQKENEKSLRKSMGCYMYM